MSVYIEREKERDYIENWDVCLCDASYYLNMHFKSIYFNKTLTLTIFYEILENFFRVCKYGGGR